MHRSLVLVTVAAEEIRARDLESVVSASGKVQPKRSVNISANQMGRVTRLAVEEGAGRRRSDGHLHVRDGRGAGAARAAELDKARPRRPEASVARRNLATPENESMSRPRNMTESRECGPWS